MERITAKRNAKDTVFSNLFSYPEYLLQMYKGLYPEDTTVTENDITTITIENILLDKMYNDLGFLVRDKLIILVEAQSTWSENIAVRIFLYLANTYNDYIKSKEYNVYSEKKFHLPKPELYVIYTGDRQDIPEKLSLAESFFNDPDSAVNVKINVLKTADIDTIIGQYIMFCKVLDSQRKIYGNDKKCIEETIKICKDKGVLMEYLADHEKEVFTIMNVLLMKIISFLLLRRSLLMKERRRDLLKVLRKIELQ